MSSTPYKAAHTHHGTLQALRVWQARLDAVRAAVEAERGDDAKELLADLRASLQPDAFPEFAANLDWLYRSAEAHLEAGKREEAAAIVAALHRLLEAAAARLHRERSSHAPFPPGPAQR